ncbi:MAG: hypothetical protein WC906_03455 [Parcubacteria group bacterium]|jgi:hypothetical protein
MDKNKKIILFSLISIILILTVVSFFAFFNKSLFFKASNNQAKIGNMETDYSDVLEEEEKYKVESKEDAKKALEDMSALVESAGNASL